MGDNCYCVRLTAVRLDLESWDEKAWLDKIHVNREEGTRPVSTGDVPIHFYIPDDQWPEDVDRLKPVYSWKENRWGQWNWTLQSFQILNDHGIACSMTRDICSPGIVFAHRGVIPDSYRPTQDHLLVCILAERIRHPFAQFHLLQDPLQKIAFRRKLGSRWDKRLLGYSTSSYIRYWPQPELIPRDRNRGSLFENVVFKGIEGNLAPELRTNAFHEKLADIGLRLRIETNKSLWNDYSDVDCVVAVRHFEKIRYSRKPATKLYNGWLAGVPVIAGIEPAFRCEGTPGRDYLEASSADEVISALINLKADFHRRQAIVSQGLLKSARYRPDRLAEDWRNLILARLNPLQEHWSSCSSKTRESFFALRRIAWCSRWVHKKLSARIGLPFNPFI